LKIAGLVLKNKYQILEKIHENDRFFSFKGLNIETEESVFIKVVRQEILLDRNRDRIKFFTEEVKALAKIKHDNVVKVYDVDFKNGILYVVSEWIDGKPLSDYIRSSYRFDFWQVIQIISQLGDVLRFAFENNIKYRTIKHSNIFISNSMEVKILSFNVPRSILSPVPLPIKENNGEDPDIFFLGVVLYELLTLKFPLDEKEMIITDLALLPEHINTTRWTLSLNDVEDPVNKEKIEKILYHSTTRKILDRYKTIKDMLEDLKELSEDNNEKKIHSGGDFLEEFGNTEEILSRRQKKENTVKETKKIDLNDDENKYAFIKIFVMAAVVLALGYFVYILLF
jgi:serine/threonine-protein kinase